MPTILQRAFLHLTRKGVAIEAGRIMLKRINELLDEGADFALETTLATRSYVSFIKKHRK